MNERHKHFGKKVNGKVKVELAEQNEMGILPHMSCVTLVNHHLLELQLPYPENGENHSICSKKLEDHTRMVLPHWGHLGSAH